MAIKIIIITICLLLSYTKKPGLWLNTINTFFHESFHALSALILGNKVKEIEFDAKLGGSCRSFSKSKFRTVITSLAGYIGCAFLPLFFLFCIENDLTHHAFLTTTLFSFFILLLYIRKTFSLVWTISFACLNLAVILIPLPLQIENTLLFIYATFILIENTKSCFTILQLSFTKPKQSGDCNILAKTTKIPALVWALVFNTTNTFVIYKILTKLFL